ncbi:hypothetical protein Tco_0574175 [Tanacetum coccineum]
MLLGINLLLLSKVNAARHKLTTAVEIAFLDKHAKSEGFEQIVDFLNASSIRYALTVNPTIYTSCIQQFWATVKVKNVNREVQLQALVDGKKIIITEATIRRDLQLEDAEGEGSEIPTDPQHTPTVTQPSSSQPQKKHKPRKSKKKDTQIPQSSVPSDNLADEAVNEENVSKHSNDPLLSGKDRLKLKELMALYKCLGEEDASKQGRKVHDIDADEDITLENVHDEDMFGVNELDGDEVVVESEVADKDINLSVDEVTLAQALVALKSVKIQEKGDVIKEPSVPVSATSTKVSTVIPTIAATTIIAVSSRPRAKGIDKGKGKMNEPELVKKLSKNDQLRLDEELAFRLQAEEEEERLAREQAQQIIEANTAWDDIRAKVEADYQLAQRLHDEEQEQYTDEEKEKFFCEFLDQRRKFFAAKRAAAKRNKPPTQAQQRKLYSTYLKNMKGYTLKQLKGFKFEVIKDMFDIVFKRVNTFVDHEKELIEESSKKGENEKESSSKRTGEELESEKSKKQKLDEKVEAVVDAAKEAEELKQCFEIVSDDGDDVTVDATPLFVKMPIRIVKVRFKKTEPVNYMDTFLHLNLKTIFKHYLKDNAWKNQQGLVKVLNWKLYDSCGVHCVTMQNILYYLLVENMYPLTKHTLHQMFNDVKLQVDYECEMAFELLTLVKKQLKEGYVPQ